MRILTIEGGRFFAVLTDGDVVYAVHLFDTREELEEAKHHAEEESGATLYWLHSIDIVTNCR